MTENAWDTETERRTEEALSLVRRQPRLRLVDHHPWVPTQERPGRRRFTLNLATVRRAWVAVVTLALALDLVVHGGHSRGWSRLGFVALALVVIQVSVRLGLKERR